MPDDDFETPTTELIQTDQLDLHTFQPADAASVTEQFLTVAQDEGYRTVRIIHGKGTGTLRRIVESVLEKHPAVSSFAQADANWGATLVELKPKD
ncbi:MAG: Smr/MutS family protein [Deltaproteobacteria bacterium]|nr:Smr/MutS family protein [Deltaproteobacteria bacterium]